MKTFILDIFLVQVYSIKSTGISEIVMRKFSQPQIPFKHKTTIESF